jgi:putative membrane protein
LRLRCAVTVTKKNMTLVQQIKNLLLAKQGFSIYLIWVFHISAMIGITLGYEDWFMTKTPLNLSFIFVLLLLSFPERSLKLWAGVAFFFVGGMFLEWVGVHYGFLFGSYAYGENLGPKLDGIPYFIGINWAVLTLTTGVIATALVKHPLLRLLIGSGLMVFLDLLLEYSAPVFDFWTFEGGLASLQNYVAWFGFSFLFHLVYQSLKLKGEKVFAYHLYAVHLVFFGYFYVFYYL